MVQLKNILQLLISIVLMSLLPGCNHGPQPIISAIAHAGGGIDGRRYTNSMEGLNYNYQRGFELFEIDFSWTSDGHLVCIHDWEQTPVWLFNYRDKTPISLALFKTWKTVELFFTPCDLSQLNQWLSTHPKAYIVTDIKINNMDGLRVMLEHIDDAKHRIIPQFFELDDYPMIKTMGFKSSIWSLYKYKGSDDSIIEIAKDMDLYAIAMPPHMAKRNLANKIKKLNIPTYVHTINDLDKAIYYQNSWGVTSVYTDFLDVDLNDQNK